MKYPVVIIGGGAAGLMCAITAAQRGRKVLLIEHAKRIGRKILMSGGGRCNFTNMYTEPQNYLSANPHFCKSALSRYSPWDFIALVEKHGIAYHEKELGQLFCDESSKLIVKMLQDEADAAGVQIMTSTSVSEIDFASGLFQLQSSRGLIQAERLVIASGGLSIPKMGATGFGYEIAQQFGHDVLPTRAGLVPFTLSGRPSENFAELAGLSSEVNLSLPSRPAAPEFRNAMLVTHRGLSGPSVLQISSYWESGDEVQVDWLLGQWDAEKLIACKREKPKAELKNLLADILPKRLALRLCELRNMQGPLNQFSDEALRQFVQTLTHWSVKPSGTEGYRTAEVTLGGVNTDHVSSRSMESAKQPGLFFIGEVLDVTGHLGGYNFQWAWASAVAAGQAL